MGPAPISCCDGCTLNSSMAMGAPWTWAHAGYCLGGAPVDPAPTRHCHGCTLGTSSHQPLLWVHPRDLHPPGTVAGSGEGPQGAEGPHAGTIPSGPTPLSLSPSLISGDRRRVVVGTMYGNVATGPHGQGSPWVPAPSTQEACSTLCPAEENPYEPLDPPGAAPSLPQVPEPPALAKSCGSSVARHRSTSRRGIRALPPSCSGSRQVLATTVALSVSVVLNVLLLTLHLRPTSRSFSLYNEAHAKCAEARGQRLTAAPCRPGVPEQLFQWVPGGRLRSGAPAGLCVTAPRALNLVLVGLEPCGAPGTLQRWECRAGGLLALAGHELYFNYRNNKQRSVMLYVGDREWSRWVERDTGQDVCSYSCCPPCAKGWSRFGDSCYFPSATTLAWEDAQRLCSALGARLLEIDSPREQEHIRTLVRGPSWLGIRDEAVEGVWTGANGSAVPREAGWWQAGEPDGGRQENCAVVEAAGTWGDRPCGSPQAWVCEGQA
ncbi:macrophage mannose receptor 1-like isoform X2 [Struthio camelus]|uniref:macrophage mannose receptor 1-like isoform X2 n=1 Tax=Struthio camelus TaxID=8801 RepID=UPI0036042B6B